VNFNNAVVQIWRIPVKLPGSSLYLRQQAALSTSFDLLELGMVDILTFKQMRKRARLDGFHAQVIQAFELVSTADTSHSINRLYLFYHRRSKLLSKYYALDEEIQRSRGSNSGAIELCDNRRLIQTEQYTREQRTGGGGKLTAKMNIWNPC